MSQSAQTAVYAAGAVCWRLIDGKVHVLVIHRTVYGDVTIPKGKVDPGESLPQTAVREIEEETGLRVALGAPLGVSRYPLPSGREKIVHYWAAEVSEQAVQRSTFRPNGEVAALEWVTIKRARGYLSYAPDVEILDAFAALVEQGVLTTFSITVLRHGITPTDGAEPSVTIRNLETGAEETFAATPTGTTGMYAAAVVFPDAGEWEYTVNDGLEATGYGISQTTTYPPVTIAEPSGGTGGSGFPVAPFLAALAAAAAFCAVVYAAVRRQRRLTPASR